MGRPVLFLQGRSRECVPECGLPPWELAPPLAEPSPHISCSPSVLTKHITVALRRVLVWTVTAGTRSVWESYRK